MSLAMPKPNNHGKRAEEDRKEDDWCEEDSDVRLFIPGYFPMSLKEWGWLHPWLYEEGTTPTLSEFL